VIYPWRTIVLMTPTPQETIPIRDATRGPAAMSICRLESNPGALTSAFALRVHERTGGDLGGARIANRG
jgi:hypothetical protein